MNKRKKTKANAKLKSNKRSLNCLKLCVKKSNHCMFSDLQTTNPGGITAGALFKLSLMTGTRNATVCMSIDVWCEHTEII